ncbi:swr complex subunit [Pleurotus ostreatus]|uniref:SWR1-complex protein 4 n=1 Tax=Pleurotus ostreatus TaxID=5322 RepID=A0A8H7DTX6_PLEOS|nr:swr complex subunit [Pleurotus ostreatus]KAF7432954.1 swr complex subunit [Pleurotus ostreatus]
MAASASDIRSALSIASQPQNPAQTPAQSKKLQAQSSRKPDGISRELYSLIGPSAPSLAAQLAKPKLKQKPNLGSRSVVKWEWRSFTNGARKDKLQLRHWTKAATDVNADYPFAKYNVQSTPYIYTDEEYTQYLQDPEWTKEETDFLFNVVREFDTRWYVIYDRYDFQGGPARSMEVSVVLFKLDTYDQSTLSPQDLKDRYYSACRKLIRNRPWSGDEASKSSLLASFHFDKEREITRKKYVASLENRTPDQVAEEEALYIEVKRLEQSERKFKKDREDLLRVLSGVESGLPDVLEDESPFNNLPIIDTKKKRKGPSSGFLPTDVDSPTSASNVIALDPPIVRKPRDPKSIAYDAQHCIIRTDLPPNVQATKAAHHPAFMRSFKLPYPKAALAPRINQIFAELGINNTRLVMPTRDNCARLEGLMEHISALVESKKILDKLEYDIQVAKKRLGIRNSEDREGGGGGGKGKGVGIGSAMDVDDGDADADAEAEEESVRDGRAQSIVSTKSARSRRPTRRSMSISSVDTNATASARASNKRKFRN